MNYSQLIEKYLRGELAEDELKKFMEELQKDPELARKVEILRASQKTISKYHRKLIKPPQQRKGIFFFKKGRIEEEVDRDIEKYSSETFDGSVTDEKEFRETVRKVIKKNRNTKRCKIFNLRKIWFIAACLLVLLSIPVIFCYLTTNIEHIYNSYYEPLKIDIVHRGESTSEKLFTTGAKEYNQANFDLAIKVFNNIPDTSRYYPFAGLYKGISYMELGKFDSAASELEAVKGDNIVMDTANWYLGLCYLKQKEVEKALNVFGEITSYQSSYSEKAQSLIKKINRYFKYIGFSAR